MPFFVVVVTDFKHVGKFHSVAGLVLFRAAAL